MLLFKHLLLNSIILIEYFLLLLFNTNIFQDIWKNKHGVPSFYFFPGSLADELAIDSA